MHFRPLLAVLIIALSQLSGCGSKGALTLPEQRPANAKQITQ